MHIMHLKEFAGKTSRLKYTDADKMKYFSCRIQNLCEMILRDCCIELEDSAEGMEKAASSTNHVGYLEFRQLIPNDIGRQCQQICSSSEESILKTFLAIVPYLIQTIKKIFVERISEVQNGLRGLPEDMLERFVSNVRDVEQNNTSYGIRKLLCVVCDILEQLCLYNCGKQPTAAIKRWGKHLAFLDILEFLEPFFQHCPQDVRLHKRLELFSGCQRDIASGRTDMANELLMCGFSNVSRSLIDFAKFDPLKLVRFELTDSTNSPVSCHCENVKYDRDCETFSQQFDVKKESEDEIQLHAIARVHVNGKICKKGAFQSVMMLNASGEEAFDRCRTPFVEVTVLKLKDNNFKNLQVVLCSTQKEKLSEVLDVLRRELGADLLDLRRPEVTQCPLTIRTVAAKVGAVVNFQLVYKWGMDAVVLDSKDFVTFADFSASCTSVPEVELVGKRNCYFIEFGSSKCSFFGLLLFVCLFVFMGKSPNHGKSLAIHWQSVHIDGI